MKYKFTNSYTGWEFIGTVDELFFKLEGTHETILNKEDAITSQGWSFDPSNAIN